MGGTSTAAVRRNDIDWIRILAVLLLIPFHSARIFDTFEPFYVKNAELSSWLGDVVVRFIGSWQMQILFLVAGAATWYALGRRRGGQYVAERLKRLLVPFFFGTLIIVPPQMYLALLHRASTSASYLGYYPQFFQPRPLDMPDYTGVGFTWAHLWFILDLFAISLIALPLFLWLRSSGGQRVVGGLASFLSRGWAIFLLFLPLAFAGELPAVHNKPFFAYLLLFLYGFVLMADERLGQTLHRHRWAAIVLAIVTMVPMYGVWLSGTQFADNSPGDVAFWIVRNLNLWCWLVAILGLGQQCLSAESRALRYAREGAYPFYLLHQTVIVAIGFFVVQWAIPVLPKFLVIVVSSLVATIVLYDVVVRRTNVTRFLFGMRPLARTTPRQIVSPVGRGGV